MGNLGDKSLKRGVPLDPTRLLAIHWWFLAGAHCDTICPHTIPHTVPVPVRTPPKIPLQVRTSSLRPPRHQRNKYRWYAAACTLNCADHRTSLLPLSSPHAHSVIILSTLPWMSPPSLQSPHHHCFCPRRYHQDITQRPIQPAGPQRRTTGAPIGAGRHHRTMKKALCGERRRHFKVEGVCSPSLQHWPI